MSRFTPSVRRSRLVSSVASVGAAVALFFALDPGADARAAADDETKALAKLDEDWSKATATKDPDVVSAFYAEDAVVYPPDEGAVRGRAAAKKMWATFLALPAFKLSWKNGHTEVAKSGDVGYTTGTYEESFDGPDGKKVTEKGKYLCVWKKQGDGQWKAIHDMWNADSK